MDSWEQVLRRSEEARRRALREIASKLTVATTAMINICVEMVDEEHDAHAPLRLVENALLEVGEKLEAVLRAIEPEAITEPLNG